MVTHQTKKRPLFLNLLTFSVNIYNVSPFGTKQSMLGTTNTLPVSVDANKRIQVVLTQKGFKWTEHNEIKLQQKDHKTIQPKIKTIP